VQPAVVVADVEVEGDYRFDRHKVGTSPGEPRALAEWLVEREVGGRRHGIDRAVLATGVGDAGAALETEAPDLGKARARSPARSISHERSRIAERAAARRIFQTRNVRAPISTRYIGGS